MKVLAWGLIGLVMLAIALFIGLSVDFFIEAIFFTANPKSLGMMIVPPIIHTLSGLVAGVSLKRLMDRYLQFTRP